MPIDNTFIKTITDKVYDSYRIELKEVNATINNERDTVLLFRDKLLKHSEQLYITSFIKAIAKLDSNLTLDEDLIRTTLKTTNQYGSDLTFKSNPLYKNYTIIICNAYLNYLEQVKRKTELLKLIKFTKPFITFLLRAYLFSVQLYILRGNMYYFSKINYYLYIFGKSVIKKNKPIINNIKNVDWGASLRYLKDRAKEVDIELYNQYNSKFISKRQFIDSMAKYKIQWHIYQEKMFNHWIMLRKRYSTTENSSLYKLIPNNGVQNKTRSQIDFTNSISTVDEILETNLLGFRDKLRALERFDMDYCLTHYNNDLQYNK